MNQRKYTKEEWRSKLEPDVFQVTREQGTEAPYSGTFWNHFETGMYHCICCEAPLFSSSTKFDAGCGWPSFFDQIKSDAIVEIEDTSHGMIRIEVRCASCDAHLGHRFPDGPEPTGQRYCINSVSMGFKPET